MTSVTSYDDRLSSICSSLIPFTFRHLKTVFEEIREECGDTLMDTLASKFDLRRHLEWFSVEHSTINDPFFSFVTCFGFLPKSISTF